MKARKLTNIVLGLTLGLTGCDDGAKPTNFKRFENASGYTSQTIDARPVSVSKSANGYLYGGNLATVVEKNGKYILASARGRVSSNKSTEAEALIQSEIVDGDSETIQLTGKYENEIFLLKGLKANGYEIEF